MTHITQAQPRERPILFNSAMVQALLAGTKTQTRRICKAKRDLGSGCVLVPHELAGEVNQLGDYSNSPYGKPGDRLWVRETFFAWGRWEARHSAKKKRDEWHFVDMTLECGHSYYYAESGNHPLPMRGRRDAGVTPGWWKRPAIFMPRAASRILLEITEVRVERLTSIDFMHAWAEGVGVPGQHYDIAEGAEMYRALWEEIHGPGSWDANPWVWCVSFRVVKP